MEISWNWIVIQSVGVLGIAAGVAAFQCSEHKRLILFRTANELLFAIQYLLLGAYTGAAMNLVGCVRNVIFGKMVERGKSTISGRILFSLLFVVFSIFTWAGMKSILIGIAKVVSTFAYGSSKTSVVRIMIFCTSLAWLVYNFLVGSYAGCLCELFTLISIIVGIVRIDISKRTSSC